MTDAFRWPVRLLFAIFILFAVFSSACAPRFTVVPRESGWTQKGVAAWYGQEFHGRMTSSGEVFDMYKLTAAHPSLPFGTIVRVTNLENGKTTVVRINDRGPLTHGRIIDLSYAAAKEIDMINRGVVKVEVIVLKAPQQQ